MSNYPLTALFLACAALAPGCGSPSGGSPDLGAADAAGDLPAGQAVRLEGAIQKGPFVLGSMVQVAQIDPRTGDPTGMVFNTTTRDDLGRFQLTLPGPATAELSTTGFYFNEISGELSKAQITLRALGQFAGPGSIYVNALTQMSYLRAKKLIAGGAPFADAVTKAEGELRGELGLAQRSPVKAGNTLNLLGGDDDANAYLFALSCVLGQAAMNEAPASVDAKLQELVGGVALSLEGGGQIAAPLKATLAGGRQALDPLRCARNLQKRLVALGSPATLPNILKAIDSDGNGKVDFDDPDADGDGVPAADDKPRLLDSDGTRNYMADAGGIVWSWETYKTTAPKPIANFKKLAGATVKGLVATGGSQAAALLSDGTVWWLPAAGSPGGVINGLAGVTALANGGYMAPGLVAVKGDGTVWKVAGGKVTQAPGLSEVIAIAGDPTELNGLAVLKKGGAVFAIPKTGPGVQLEAIPGLTDVTAIAGLSWYQDGFVALKADGTLWTWSGTQAQKVADDVLAVEANGAYFVKKDGTVQRRQGTMVTPLPTGLAAKSVAVGPFARMVVLDDGSLQSLVDPNSPMRAYEAVYIPR